MDIFTIFITGLFAGGLTCLAVQGGLLASSIAQVESSQQKTSIGRQDHLLPVLSFLAARLFSYTALGIVLGALGSIVQLSLQTRVVLQTGVVIFMIGTALHMLDIHPIFRYMVIQPPRFLTKLVKKQSKTASVYGPALLGLSTILIPCGATQAMMAYAVSTGSWISGGITMFVFILGTSPVFFLLGYAAKRLGAATNKRLNTVAAISILIIALYNANSTIAISGFHVPKSYSTQSSQKHPTSTKQATIYLTQSGYKTDPETIAIKGGDSVTLHLVNQNGYGCIQAFTIPTLGIQKTIPVGKSEDISFTAPIDSSTLSFMCSMGMFRGVINII